MTTLYGIKNCDTIKKSRRWLEQNNIEYQFHDYRKDGISADQLKQWCEELGWENLLNKRGTTWRKLPEETKESIDLEKSIVVMLEQPAIIKRPLLVAGKTKLLGFKEEQYSALCNYSAKKRLTCFFGKFPGG
ncbi:MAG: ArsC family reductase, partial [Pseudomonadales bacterium]|nr:ArsC family reductase [Pseudomonadales bacterium]